MSDISKFSPDGGTTEYNIKDTTARENASLALSTAQGKVSAVTVTQTVSSGTEVAEVDVDGTKTKIYAPNSTITIDTVVTQGSTNAVSGGAVYTYVDTMITQALSASY